MKFRLIIWPRHLLQRTRFPIRQIHFHYRVTFTGLFDVFVLLRRMTLWPWPLTFWPWQCCSCPTHIRIFIILWLSVTELRVLNIWSHFRYLKQSLRMRRVTWPLTGSKNCLHFWNPWPQFTYSLCHFHGATTKIKPCYRQKIAFSHYEGYKVYCACAVSRDLCIGGPPKPHVNFLTPNCLSLYNFYAATMTIKGSFYWSIPMLKRFSVAKKRPVKIGPRNGGFSEV